MNRTAIAAAALGLGALAGCSTAAGTHPAAASHPAGPATRPPSSSLAPVAVLGSVPACTQLMAYNWNRLDTVTGTGCYGLSNAQIQGIANRLIACKADGACAGLTAGQIRLVKGGRS